MGTLPGKPKAKNTAINVTESIKNVGFSGNSCQSLHMYMKIIGKINTNFLYHTLHLINYGMYSQT